MLIEFITKYWLEVLFSLICGGAAWMVRHHVKLIIEDRARHEKDLIEALEKKMDEQREGMQCQMDACYNRLLAVVNERDEKLLEEDKKIYCEMDAIKDGMLSIQGRAFKADCRRLLEEGHIITLKEYEDLLAEHITYNGLGGNHEGDGLFSMVQAKYQGELITPPRAAE